MPCDGRDFGRPAARADSHGFRPHRRVNAGTDFSRCSSLFGSAIFARASPRINSTTSLAPYCGLANPAIRPGVGARLLRFLEAADERDELPAIII